jgi:hypothetical protein
MIITPKLKISAFIDMMPWVKYSGAIYPLQHDTKVWGTIDVNKAIQSSRRKEKQQIQEELITVIRHDYQ